MRLQRPVWVCLINRMKTVSSESRWWFIGNCGLSWRRGGSVNLLILFAVLHYPGVSIFSPPPLWILFPLCNTHLPILCNQLIVNHLHEMDAIPSRSRRPDALGKLKKLLKEKKRGFKNENSRCHGSVLQHKKHILYVNIVFQLNLLRLIAIMIFQTLNPCGPPPAAQDVEQLC